MIPSRSSAFRLLVKRGLKLIGENLISFSDRISYSPMNIVARQGNWIVCQDNGIEWRLDISLGVDSSIYRTGGFEPDSTKWLYEFIKPGMVVVDVGANFGYYSILSAKLVGNDGRVVAFEPLKKFYDRLIDHIDRNHCNQITAVQCGLSEKEEELTLYDGGDSASFYLTNENEPVQITEAVKLITLDSYIAHNEIGRVDFIKVDIDGHEVKFLRGAKATIRRFKPILMVEFMQLALQQAGSGAEELASEISNLGYMLCSEKTGRPFVNHSHLLQEVKNCAFSANILCIPERDTRQ